MERLGSNSALAAPRQPGKEAGDVAAPFGMGAADGVAVAAVGVGFKVHHGVAPGLIGKFDLLMQIWGFIEKRANETFQAFR